MPPPTSNPRLRSSSRTSCRNIINRRPRPTRIANSAISLLRRIRHLANRPPRTIHPVRHRSLLLARIRYRSRRTSSPATIQVDPPPRPFNRQTRSTMYDHRLPLCWCSPRLPIAQTLPRRPLPLRQQEGTRSLRKRLLARARACDTNTRLLPINSRGRTAIHMAPGLLRSSRALHRCRQSPRPAVPTLRSVHSRRTRHPPRPPLTARTNTVLPSRTVAR